MRALWLSEESCLAFAVCSRIALWLSRIAVWSTRWQANLSRVRNAPSESFRNARSQRSAHGLAHQVSLRVRFLAFGETPRLPSRCFPRQGGSTRLYSPPCSTSEALLAFRENGVSSRLNRLNSPCHPLLPLIPNRLSLRPVFPPSNYASSFCVPCGLCPSLPFLQLGKESEP